MHTEGLEHSEKQSAESMIKKATEFLKTLHPPQRDMTPGNEYALFHFADKNREVFDYFAPSSRLFRGLPLRYMNPSQQQAAKELLKVSLSAKGFERVQQIHMLENVLAAKERVNPIFIRDSQAYYVTVFGTPSLTGAWSWRYEGHHLSLHWTISNGKIISSTPQFIGAQPAKVREEEVVEGGLPSGTRVLGREEDLAWDLIEMLSDEQKLTAKSEVSWDLPEADRPYRLEDRGIAYGVLAKDQQEKLRELIIEHTNVQIASLAQERLVKIDRAGWDRVKFFFMGGSERGELLEYRVRIRDTFAIGYNNNAFTQPNVPANERANHQHTVWRDYASDWGRDSL